MKVHKYLSTWFGETGSDAGPSSGLDPGQTHPAKPLNYIPVKLGFLPKCKHFYSGFLELDPGFEGDPVLEARYET